MERNGQSTQPESGEESLRRKLLKRIALAAILIAVLLGGLAMIDRYFGPPPPVSGNAPLSANLKPLPAPPQVAPPPAAPQADQAEAEPAKAEPEETAAPLIDKGAPRPKPIASAPLPSTTAKSAARPAESPVTNPAPTQAAEAAATHPLSHEKSTRQLVWQLGVFQDVGNAEKLRDKLAQAGIPNRIEARVQVGPFKNRQEAQDARKKLIGMGLNPSLLLPVKK